MTIYVSGNALSTILRHDKKDATYKIALLRAINDIALSYPDIHLHGKPIALPLRIIAEWWLAYYWPFVDAGAPIWQRKTTPRDGSRSDMSFRTVLTNLRLHWEQHIIGTASQPSDGFYLRNEMNIARRRANYHVDFVQMYEKTLRKIGDAVEQPIQYAGGSAHWSVFSKPVPYLRLQGLAVAIPGTFLVEKCVLIPLDLWNLFRSMSLWIESLCIHEWCLFTETLEQQNSNGAIDRGIVYRLLTDRPDNRRPLTWERNHIDILLYEGKVFTCPWTEKLITAQNKYDLDHLLPISIYPINELWNLVPTDPHFNSHSKRDRLPSAAKLQRAIPHLSEAYQNYETSTELARVLKEDVDKRFSKVQSSSSMRFSVNVASAVASYLDDVATARNLLRF